MMQITIDFELKKAFGTTKICETVGVRLFSLIAQRTSVQHVFWLHVIPCSHRGKQCH